MNETTTYYTEMSAVKKPGTSILTDIATTKTEQNLAIQMTP